MIVKICGVRNLRELEMVQKYADATGVVVGCGSRRRVEMRVAKRLVEEARIPVYAVSTRNSFEGWQEIMDLVSPDHIQIHSDMDAKDVERLKSEYGVGIMKVFFVPRKSYEPASTAERLEELINEYEVDRILLDAGCGSGGVHDFRVSRLLSKVFDVMIAGGLNPTNVGNIVEFVKPIGVDVSSGVEEKGEKSEKLVKEFARIAKETKNSVSLF